MVSLELLSSLDGMLWLQSGTNVGVIFQQHQTTVSRNQKKCAQILGITLSKFKNKWVTQGDLMLLQLERKVHQFARLQGKARLRIEVNGWIESAHFNPAPTGWVAGSSSHLGDPHGIQCLKDRIIDACLCPLMDPLYESQDLAIIPLNTNTEVGIATLKQHTNQDRIIDLVNTLKQI